MFDRVEITVKSGKGGDGIASFRREKFVPLGGPDGGDGGSGGDVVIKADSKESSLKKYYFKKTCHADDGKPGQSRKKTGKSGKNLVLAVPPGTLVTDITDIIHRYEVADLNQDGETITTTKGGRGGIGNVHFSSSTNQAPRLASKGEPGEEKKLLLELKLIADVGLVGLPNAGKSSLLAASSKARPKIASYPFTTLEPELGVVERDLQSFIMADIPGLISGAADGKGLGYEFLRHIIRTRLLVHVVDGSSENAFDDFETVNRELEIYEPGLLRKKQIVVVNKIDLEQTEQNTPEILRSFVSNGYNIDFISALTGEGVQSLLDKIFRLLDKEKTAPSPEKPAEPKVFRPAPRKEKLTIVKTGDTFEIIDQELERIIEGSQVNEAEVRRQIWGLITRQGAVKILEKKGIKTGDTVKIGSFEWRW